MSQSQPRKSRPNLIQRFLRWLFGAPFKDLGEPFGDPIPPEMHKFEAEADEMTHVPRGTVMPKGTQHTPPPSPDK